MISLAFAGLTTKCGNLLTDYYCPHHPGFIHLSSASSLEACPSECETTGDGAVGCCVWQHDWNKCIWYADTQSSQVTNVNHHGYRSAVSCTSKRNEIVARKHQFQTIELLIHILHK